MFESTCVIGERGQITIPKEIRDKEGLKKKDRLICKLENNRVVLEKQMSKKKKEALLKEYYQKYYSREKEISKEWAYASKEADAGLDDY